MKFSIKDFFNKCDQICRKLYARLICFQVTRSSKVTILYCFIRQIISSGVDDTTLTEKYNFVIPPCQTFLEGYYHEIMS